jgi:hypothetical protein
VAPLRGRLPLQPPDREVDARLRFRCHSRRRRVARHAADRPSARGGTGDSVIWTVVDFAGADKKYLRKSLSKGA